MKRTSFRKTLFLFLAFLLAAGTIGAGLFFARASGSSDLVVPYLIGKSQSSALSSASDAGISEEHISFRYDYDETVPVNTVLFQSIEPQKKISKDDILNLTLSLGPDPETSFSLPDFRQKPRSDAEEWSRDHQFSDVQYRYQMSSLPVNTVISSDPAAGKTVRRGQRITVTLSSGDSTDGEITVPSFSSAKRREIEVWGNDHLISIAFETRASETVPEGEILSVTPKEGSTIRRTGTVTVVLSSGPNVPVVNHVGKTYSETSSWLENYDLKPVLRGVYSDEPAGTVLSQLPSAGSMSKGAPVLFEVSAGAIHLPDFTGHSLNEFEAYIDALNAGSPQNANLSVSITEQETEADRELILHQSDTGTVSPGTEITVAVGIRKRVKLTDQSGKTEAELRSYLKNLNLNPGIVHYAFSSSIKQGSVISNDTGTFSSGDAVSYTVSKGPCPFDYQSLIQKNKSWETLNQAAQEARQNGWIIDMEEVESEAIKPGHMIDACTVSGTHIHCRVSLGSIITVPDVTGMNYEAALSTLRAAGLSPRSAETSHQNKPYGEVIGQSISGGTPVHANEPILITWSNREASKKTAELPRFDLHLFDGKDEAEIKTALTELYRRAGFENLVFTVDSSNQWNENGIAGITPVPDSSTLETDAEIQVLLRVRH